MTLKGMRVLVIEDDPATGDILNTFLKGQGALVEVVDDGVAGLKAFQAQSPDVVLLDLMLPGMDGWDVLSVLKQHPVPVIAITAQDDVDDVVRGLSEGFEDYITKPFRLREVLARINKALQRAQPQRPATYTVGDLFIDDGRKEVMLKARPISLTKKEYLLLFELAQQPGKVYSERELIEKVWDAGGLATAADVKRYIHLLRQKIEEDPSQPRYIQTVRGFGYKLEA